MTAQIRRHGLRVTGTVQGVGFRPFVYRLATSLELNGFVCNDDEGVWCEVEGLAAMLGEFARRVDSDAPPLAVIVSFEVIELATTGQAGFTIEQMPGQAAGAGLQAGPQLIPADVAPCPTCLGEVAHPADRRYRYPFTCCTDCGPRFTVVDRLPYDRAATSMAAFPLCGSCSAEYADPNDRRFHAQATCCADCGPTVCLVNQGAEVTGEAALAQAASLLGGGRIVALKGLGGYQLICRADDPSSVRALRERKHREEKPFAVMVASVEAARRLVDLDAAGERLLVSPEAPIVLASERPDAGLADGVAPGTGLLGVMLPASPLHAILAADIAVPLVCTSGNLSGAPIIVDDDQARAELMAIADAMLTHDRRIARRADDSVAQVVLRRPQLLRRGRGFAPRSVSLFSDGPTILGVGAELKSTTCLARGRNAGVSVHLGDLENPATFLAFEQAVVDQLHMAQATPDLVVHDLHPEYLSTKFAVAQDMAPTLAVQHHHAHLVSCLVDNAHAGPAIGVTFDGIGWGTDGTAWGGEFLIGDAIGLDRAAHLDTVALPGGAAAVREPWRMAVSHLVAAYGSALPDSPVLQRHADAAVVASLCGDANTLSTSSIGRLFDAVAALCGVADNVSYEGQAAIGLEQLADPSCRPYSWPAEESAISATPLVRAIVDDLAAGVATTTVAGRFHHSIATMVAAVCARLRDETGVAVVALTGGVFQNRLLVELAVPLLETAGFEVLLHRQVPPNDGGISLGQVAIARAHLRNGLSSTQI